MSQATKHCPVCGEEILAVARKCRFCGEYLDPSARPREAAPSTLDRALMPVGRPGSAIAAGYLGLFSLFPLIGMVAAPMAIYYGVTALKLIRSNSELSGKGRAWFGIVMGSLTLLAWGSLIVVMVVGALSEQRRMGL